MRVRIFIPGSDDEIIARDVRYDDGLYIGKVDWLRCKGEILALFHQLEEAANNIGLREAERLEKEIERLGFVVELPGRTDPTVASMLQVMNGDDVAFRVAVDREPGAAQ